MLFPSLHRLRACCGMWAFIVFSICLLDFLLLRATVTQVYILGLQTIFHQMAYFCLTATNNITSLPNFANVTVSTICCLFRWSPHATFFSSCSPHDPTQKGPIQLVLIIQRTARALCWWHSHPLSASFASRGYGTSHAFLLAFRGPMKSICYCCPAPAMPQTHLSPDLMQVAFQMHWDARTLKVWLDLRRHWPWRHILTVQRGRTVWANPTLSQPLSSLFLFPDLNQCLFFSSQQHGIWFPASVPIPPPNPQLTPPFICLGPLTLLSWVCSERTLLNITGATETLDGAGLSRQDIRLTSLR